MRNRYRRDVRHWNALRFMPPARYRRALRLWRGLFGVRPCGLVCAAPNGQVGLNLVRE